jgi:hypothetical protein
VVVFPAGARDFSLPQRFQTSSGAHPVPIQLVPYTVSTRIIRPGRETDQSDATNAKVKNAWSYTASTPYVFITLTGILLIEIFSYFIKLVFKRK